jgi:hypothetical protein
MLDLGDALPTFEPLELVADVRLKAELGDAYGTGILLFWYLLIDTHFI